MIYKKNSSEFMEAFDNATNKLQEAQNNIDTIKDSIEKRLKILNYSNDYTLKSLSELKLKSTEGTVQNKILLPFSNVVGGSFDSFGMTMHPKFLKTPNNLFNFMSGTGPIFKNNVTVYINTQEDEEAKNFLMDDRINNKDYFIKEYDSDILEIDIYTQDNGVIGDMRFNTIELLPYLPGSFNIESIEVFEVGDKDTAVHTIHDINDCSQSRIILDEKITMSHTKFKIKLKYKNSDGKYVFGFKHLYFLNADYSVNSFAIIQIDKPEAIEYIYDTVLVHSQFGQSDKIKAADLNIEFYISYDYEVLNRIIELSSDTNPNYISANTKIVYMRMPITTSLMAITPDIRIFSPNT